MTMILEMISPYIRLVMFTMFTFLGVMASFILSEVFNDKFYTEAGLFPIKTGEYEYVHIANIVKTLIQIFACILCGIKVIQVPHATFVKPKTLADKYIWSTHEAVLLVIASGVNSNTLAERFFTNDFFVVVANDSDNDIQFLNSEDFHMFLKFGMIYSRFFCMAIGTAFFLYNMSFRNEYFNQPPNDPSEVASIACNVIMFLTQFIYGSIHFAELWPDSLIPLVKNVDTHAIIKERHLEFVSENLSELLLALFGIALAVYSCKPDNTRNSLAATTIFNTVFLGMYGSFYAVRTAFATHVIKKEANTAWVPMAVFILTIAVTFASDAIVYRRSVKATFKDRVLIFYNAMGANYSLVSFLWKLSIAGGLAALLMALFSTQAQWFTFDIKAGSIPRSVSHVTKVIVEDIESVGHKGFEVIKQLDPCSWNAHKGGNSAINSNVEYDYNDTVYGKRPFTRRSAFSLQDADLQSSDCSCKNNHICSCDYINGIKGKITDKREEQTTFAKNNLQHVLDGYVDFTEWHDDSEYLNSLSYCHAIECDIVLGIAIAAETIILAEDVVSFLPLPGESEEVAAADSEAWFSQMANRVSHGIIKYATATAKTVQGLHTRIKQFKPMVTLLIELETKTFQEKYQMSLDLLMVYLPLFVNGAVCFLIGFWRRENIHKVFQTFGVVLTFYIPLVLLNLTMVGLMFLFPYVVEDACKIIPKTLIIVTPKEHVGFSLLRNAYILSTISTLMLLISSLLDDAYFLRKKAGVLRKALRAATMTTQTSAGGGDEKRRTMIDIGWLQAFIVSVAVPILFAMSYYYNWSFVDMKYGPTGSLLKVANAFHSHTNILQDTQNYQQHTQDVNFCGLIGKAVESATKFVVKELDVLIGEIVNKAEVFVESVIHLSDIISKFEKIGRSTFHVLSDTWEIAEKTITLIIPLMCSLIMLTMAFVLPRLNEGRDEVEKIAKQIIMVGIYYNVAMLVMMQQLFSTISNLKMHIFYFEFKSGILVMVGFICTALIAVSVFSLYVNKIYKVES
jgi:hypothetical protein